MHQFYRKITACLILSWLACAFTGCGGAPKMAPPPIIKNANAAPPSPVAPAMPGGGAANTAATASGKPKPGKAASTAETTEEEPPGPDDFVMSSDQIVTEIENPKPKPAPIPFEVTPIQNGLDSSNLVLADAATTPTENGGTTAFPMHAAVNPRNASNTTPNPAAVKPAGGQPSVAGQNAAGQAAAGSDAWSLPKGFTAAAGSQIDPETGLPWRIQAERDSVEMVLIPPGVSLRGADVKDPTVSPRHTILLENPYYIDAVEVTVSRYNAFREFFRKTEGRKLDGSVNHDGNPDFPAVGIKFFDAKFYAKWLSKELPTETQWERAARGDKGFNYPWGEGRPIFQLPRVPGQLDPVGIFPGDRSPFGVYDMAGNAREWCLDLYQADIYQKDITLGAGTVRNPIGPKSAPGIKQQVVRGGHDDWAIWHRSGMAQNETAPDIGFRCVLNIVPAAKSKSDKTDKGTLKKADDKKKPAAKF
jgi:sulfatase modifying factor 1